MRRRETPDLSWLWWLALICAAIALNEAIKIFLGVG